MDCHLEIIKGGDTGIARKKALTKLKRKHPSLAKLFLLFSAIVPERSASTLRDSTRVFVVHGHDAEVRESVARFLERLELQPVILQEQPNRGRTLITKFRDEASSVGFAIVLLTPDDVGKANGAMSPRARARQNVVFELGFFIGVLGPERVAAIVRGDVEHPSDFHGVVYIAYDGNDWQTELGKELQAAGYNIDWNRFMKPNASSAPVRKPAKPVSYTHLTLPTILRV